MLLQAQASISVKLSMRLWSFLTQDLSYTFRVIKAVEQADPKTPVHTVALVIYSQSLSKSVALESSDNPLGSPAGGCSQNSVSYSVRKVASGLGTSCRCKLKLRQEN